MSIRLLADACIPHKEGRTDCLLLVYYDFIRQYRNQTLNYVLIKGYDRCGHGSSKSPATSAIFLKWSGWELAAYRSALPVTDGCLGAKVMSTDFAVSLPPAMAPPPQCA